MPTGTAKDFAELIGKTQSFVTRLKNAGVLDAALVYPEGAKRPVIDMDIALKAYQESIVKGPGDNGDPAPASADNVGEKTSGKGASGNQTYIEARTWSERYKAAERKLNFEIRQGKWIQKADVNNASFKAGRILRDAWENIPARTAARIAAKSKKAEKEIMQILRDEMRLGLEECVRSLSAIGE